MDGDIRKGFKEQTVRVYVEFVWLGVEFSEGYFGIRMNGNLCL
jgi:hypothetical protein